MENFEKLEKSIGDTFKNKDLLKKALTHRSYAYENRIESNEKLEFLGDSILEFISSKYIYNNYPKLKEGEKLQMNGEVNIRYTIIEEKGPDHDKTFTAEVSCNNKKLAIGKGKTKKQAEMEAARKALEYMK